MAFSRLQPFMDEREFRRDARMAQLCQLYANSKRPKGKPPLALEDFILLWRGERAPVEAKSDEELLVKFTAAMGVAKPNKGI